MDKSYNQPIFFRVIIVALIVYCFAHFDAIRSPYVINDDVRQQIYWMQQWQDPALYQDHYLTDYAKNYVPWGVKAIYWGASQFLNPVQFSKILTAMLFALSAGLLFILASREKDELTGVLTVCVFFYFGNSLGAVSGGLSRGFVFPFLLLYLVLLTRGNKGYAALVLMIQPLFNPYLFLLCLFTHGLFLVRTRFLNHLRFGSNSLLVSGEDKGSCRVGSYVQEWGHLIPVIIGIVLLVIRYQILQSPEFGSMLSKAEMVGHPEYTASGRYEIIPVPSILFELIRPFLNYQPRGFIAIVATVLGVAIMLCLVILKTNLYTLKRIIRRCEIFVYLLAASVILYILARTFLMTLFLPERYLEYSLTVFYCILAGALLSSAVRCIKTKKFRIFIVSSLIILGACRLNGIALFDYRDQVLLYQFFLKTPPDVRVAGHPNLMDNVLTFSKRNVFVSYELSHPWSGKYWSTIKPWTYDFFNAYYSDNPIDIRMFCREYSIDYVVVREADFVRDDIEHAIYFEPFGGHIKSLFRKNQVFAILDKELFKPVFQHDGIRIITP